MSINLRPETGYYFRKNFNFKQRNVQRKQKASIFYVFRCYGFLLS